VSQSDEYAAIIDPGNRVSAEERGRWAAEANRLGVPAVQFSHISGCRICRNSRNAVREAQAAERRAAVIAAFDRARRFDRAVDGAFRVPEYLRRNEPLELRPAGASMEYVPPMNTGAAPVLSAPYTGAQGISHDVARARFEPVPVTDLGRIVLSNFADSFKRLAGQIAFLPSSREQSLALTALEEASHWANRAIALKHREVKG
jgi:hypothetical protein